MKQIVAFGGGGFSMESGNPLLDDYVLGLTGSAEPKVCFLPTASGDADHYLVRFYNAFRERAKPSHVSLFRRERGASDVRSHLLSQDMIYVGGGSLVSLLGVWRAHGIDEILREAWEAGVVLCGLSAGSLCWFTEAVSGYHGEVSRVEALGFLPHTNAVHYCEGEPASCLPQAPAGRHALGVREPRTAPRCASSGTSSSRWSPSRPEARAYRLERRGIAGPRDTASHAVPGRRCDTRVGASPVGAACGRRIGGR